MLSTLFFLHAGLPLVTYLGGQIASYTNMTYDENRMREVKYVLVIAFIIFVVLCALYWVAGLCVEVFCEETDKKNHSIVVFKEEPKKEVREEPKKEVKEEPKKEVKKEVKEEVTEEPKKEVKEEPKKEDEEPISIDTVGYGSEVKPAPKKKPKKKAKKSKLVV